MHNPPSRERRYDSGYRYKLLKRITGREGLHTSTYSIWADPITEFYRSDIWAKQNQASGQVEPSPELRFEQCAPIRSPSPGPSRAEPNLDWAKPRWAKRQVISRAEPWESILDHGWRIVETPEGAFRLLTIQFKAQRLTIAAPFIYLPKFKLKST